MGKGRRGRRGAKETQDVIVFSWLVHFSPPTRRTSFSIECEKATGQRGKSRVGELGRDDEGE